MKRMVVSVKSCAEKKFGEHVPTGQKKLSAQTES